MKNKRQQLFFSLKVLKEGRRKVLIDTLEEAPILFRPMVKFGEHSIQLRLHFDKYWMIWLDFHWDIAKKIIQLDNLGENEKQQLLRGFSVPFRELLNYFSITLKEQENVFLFESLIKTKMAALSNIIESSNSLDEKLDRILYENEKARMLLEKRINELKRKKNGI